MACRRASEGSYRSPPRRSSQSCGILRCCTLSVRRADIGVVHIEANQDFPLVTQDIEVYRIENNPLIGREHTEV